MIQTSSLHKLLKQVNHELLTVFVLALTPPNQIHEEWTITIEIIYKAGMLEVPRALTQAVMS